MPNLDERGGVAVGGAPSWCQEPQRCDASPAKLKECGKCRNIPHLPAAESNFVEGSRSVWVYYPQGILRRPVSEGDLPATRPAQPRSFLPHECRGAKSAPEVLETAPYPGHSLFQDSFLFCKFKKVGDAPGLEEVYVETVVDGCTGLAFAKVYSAESGVNATDIFETRVVPFFARHGVPIEQVITTGADEYCGTPLLHPFETYLAASNIRHTQTERSGKLHSPLCMQFFGILQHEFLAPALRGRFQHTVESLQQELDHFLDAYNHARPSLAPGMQGRPPLRAFLDTARA
ncbi:MAG: hypothetical protein LAO08_07750 [Acidobacteriia bacterium]|nr:hypothetical protein [Terriglobia bacterium]